ncbi:MAG: circadian clock protein KaiB [Deltaproteobacteria bacterium]|nr:MAG: circadian clock protein KaiB [Deltaproteobacteria bacterium]
MKKDSRKFRLYLLNKTARSLLALANLHKICNERLKSKYDIQVVDLQQSPQLATRDQIVSIPTLVRIYPKSEKKVIGDLSDTGRVGAFELGPEA